MAGNFLKNFRGDTSAMLNELFEYYFEAKF